MDSLCQNLASSSLLNEEVQDESNREECNASPTIRRSSVYLKLWNYAYDKITEASNANTSTEDLVVNFDEQEILDLELFKPRSTQRSDTIGKSIIQIIEKGYDEQVEGNKLHTINYRDKIRLAINKKDGGFDFGVVEEDKEDNVNNFESQHAFTTTAKDNTLTFSSNGNHVTMNLNNCNVHMREILESEEEYRKWKEENDKDLEKFLEEEEEGRRHLRRTIH